MKRAIVDKWTRIPEGAEVGYDRATDEGRGFTVTESGITVLPAGYRFPS